MPLCPVSYTELAFKKMFSFITFSQLQFPLVLICDIKIYSTKYAASNIKIINIQVYFMG